VELEYVACNLCDGEETLHLFSSLERRFGLSGRFDVVQCRGCGLVYLNPRPTAREMQRYYPADRYFPYRKIVRRDGFVQSVRLGLKRMVLAEHRGYPQRRDLAGLPLLATKLATKLLRSRLRGLPEYISGGKLLDVGCGSGNYLYSLRELGWDVYGMEIDEGAAGYARDRLGLKVFSGTLEEADFPDAFFDVVTMRQVLEHLSDPSSSLIEVHRVLKPGGRLMVEVPNIASLTAAMFKNWWFNLDAPRHLYAFRPRTLQAMLEKSGFAQVKIEHLADTSGTTGSLQYLWNARTKDPKGNGIRHSKALHLVLWPITFLLARLGRGEMIRAWSMKSEGSQLGR
jgi:2-polyprenyl-3-methyl-5-hydroxy-6-metoxy-1,4-benzoquinol methylase